MSKSKSKNTKNDNVIEYADNDITMKSDIEHVLSLPDTYVGSIENDTGDMWVYDDELKRIVKKEIKFTSAFFKCCDEIIQNARDSYVRDKTCNIIKFNIDREKNMISVYNNGAGVPVIYDDKCNMYKPQMAFGCLRTSSNYDKGASVLGSRNGLGSKCTNIFSKKFTVETLDPRTNKKYVQEFSNNMTVVGKPLITDMKKGEMPYTKITFEPDLQRFHMKSLNNDIVSLLKRRAYDIAACTDESVKVYFNDELLKVKTFEDFIKLHYETSPNLVYEEVDVKVDIISNGKPAKIDAKWKIGIVFAPDSGYSNISFVNGISTYNGGTHCEYIMNQITKKIIDISKQKNKSINIKPNQIREHVTLFLDTTIAGPAFSSQCKDTLVTKQINFGSTCELDNVFINKIIKTGLLDVVIKYAQLKEMSSLKQTDGKKTNSVRDIPKLEDANWAGTRKSKETRLILTEGDSAKSFAISGLRIIGRDKFGVFPLRGKLLNVRNATAAQIKKNAEFINLKKIMGLKQNTTYNDVSKLRYGGIIILTDEDDDGSHIKGLIINMFQYFWPELLKVDGFIQTMSTPLIKAFKKSDTKKKNPMVFYTLSDFEKWVHEDMNNDVSKWNIKYYKGLGTSDEKESKEVFNDFENRVVSFIWESSKGEDQETNSKGSKKEDSDYDNNDDFGSESSSDESSDGDSETKSNNDDSIYNSVSYDAITLAFDESRANDRKKWLTKYNRNIALELNKKKVKYSDFINKDLIHFSNYDNIRSLPSIVDGNKPSQRKILYACFKKGQRSEIKVAQLASYVAEHTAYKHGEVSLQEAIVGMAQRFPGSNNIYLLHPSGNFGHRKQGGDEHASPRYIFTYIEPLTLKIFRKEDESILKYIEDEGEIVEPEYYLPIIPMILVNGGHGVGTGFSTNVPQYNPIDIANNLLRQLDGKEMFEMDPWYHGFTGKIDRVAEGKYKITGKYDIVGDNVVKVTEIPIKGLHCWIDKYNEFLDTLVDNKDDPKKKVANVKTNCGNNEIDFEIEFKGTELQKMVKKGGDEIEKFLKLSVNMSVSNLYLYNTKGVITRYETPMDIMEEFYEFRLAMYTIRKKEHLKLLNNELEILRNKVRYINEVRNKTIVVADQKQADIIAKLEKTGYPRMSHKLSATDEEKSYDYLTDMKLFSLTKEKVDELNKLYNDKKNEYDDYNSTTEIEMWKRELNEFITAYKQWLVDRKNDEEDDDDDDKKGKKKKKTKKSAKKNDSDDEETKPKKVDKSKKVKKSESKSRS